MSLEDEDKRVALKAAEILLDRGWGKPAQPVVGSDDDPPVKLEEVRRTVVDPVNPHP